VQLANDRPHKLRLNNGQKDRLPQLFVNIFPTRFRFPFLHPLFFLVSLLLFIWWGIREEVSPYAGRETYPLQEEVYLLTMDFQLQQQLQEKARLKQELEIAKRAIKTSEACDTYVQGRITHTRPLPAPFLFPLVDR
jgi:hypothetical protein